MEIRYPPLLFDVFFGFLLVDRVCSDGGVCFFVHFFYLEKNKCDTQKIIYMRFYLFIIRLCTKSGHFSAYVMTCLASLSPVLKRTVNIS